MNAPSQPLSPGRRERRRGSIIIVALVFSTALTMLVSSYIGLALNEYKLADESLQANALVNLAEAGAEEAVYALSTGDWTGWTQPDSRWAYKAITGLPAGKGRNGMVTIVIDGYDDLPTVIVESSITNPSGRTLTKQVQMDLTFRSQFASGLVAKDKLRFVGGNASVDSYNSGNGVWNAVTNRGDKGTAGSLSVEADAVDVGNAKIWGYVATGASTPTFGPNGEVRGPSTAPGVKVDWERITMDFYADFPDVDHPPGTGALTALPTARTKNIGTAGVMTTYKLSSLALRSNETLNINGPVTIIVDGNTDIKGAVNITANGSVAFYAAGDFVVGGNGIVNQTNVPAKFMIYGTSKVPLEQDFTLHGNAAMHGVVYAPNAYVSFRGGGGSGYLAGAAIGYQIFMNGVYEFHYDEALEDMNQGRPTYKMRRWLELTGERERYDIQEMTGTLRPETFQWVVDPEVGDEGDTSLIGNTLGAVGGLLGQTGG